LYAGSLVKWYWDFEMDLNNKTIIVKPHTLSPWNPAIHDTLIVKQILEQSLLFQKHFK